MIPLLAQASPPPEALKQWMEVFFWLAGGVLACVMLWRQLTGSGDKQIREVHGRIGRERLEINKEIADLKAADARLNEKLDREIKDLRDDVIAVPKEVVALLRETKGLLG